MFVEHLSLIDFRSYASAEVSLNAGVTLFIGSNGQGKTNLVEAVEYLSTLGSHRVSTDAPMVRSGATQAIIRGRVRAGSEDDRSLLLEVELNPGRANRVRINRNPLKRPRDLVGVLRTVVFAPDDLRMVKGDPADRRRFLDEVVITRWPRMAGVRADYDKVLRQRNHLLKSLAGRRTDDEATLAVWDEHLARVGAELLAARLDTIDELMPHAATAYADIAPVNNTATARYESSVDRSHPDGPSDTRDRDELAIRLMAALHARRADELIRGQSLVGPHRDDLMLSIGELPAKGYASHGESWSLALALRLGAFALVRADGVEPVLVLDDVFAELDQTRRQRLADAIADADQVLITAAVAEDVPAQLAGNRYRVAGGNVSPEADQAHQRPEGGEDHEPGS